MNIISIIFIAVCVILIIPLMWWTHCGLERCYVWFGYRFCKKHDLIISRFKVGPEFEESGVKTEYSIVEFDCVDTEEVRQLVRLRVWIFGIRKVLSIEEFIDEEETI